MKKSILALLAVSSALSFNASAATYDADVSHSMVGFSVKHLMISTVRGNFGDFAGSLVTPEGKEDFTKAKVDFTVKAASINTNNAKRDEHLRSPEFFDTAKFADAKFVSTKIAASGKDKYKLTGDLTIHGVTKPVTFDATFTGKNKDPWGNDKIAFVASTQINRKDFGLTWNKALETGGVVVGDEVKMDLEMEFTAKK